MMAVDSILPGAADTGVKSDEEEKIATTTSDLDTAILTTESTSSWTCHEEKNEKVH